MHLDDEEIQRLMHGELSPPRTAAAREHVRECAECDARVAAAASEEREIEVLLEQLDSRRPAVQAETVATRARGWGAGSIGDGRDSARARWGRRAAGALLALGVATAVYAAPGSPIPRWIAAAGDHIVRQEGGNERAAAAPGAAQRGGAGLAVDPGERLVIRFSSARSGGRLVVTLTDADAVTITTVGGNAIFTSAPELVLVENTSRATVFDIEIPRGAEHVEILIEGRSVFVKRGAAVTSVVDPDAGGVYRLALDSQAPPGS